jgi:hypothetical protein
MRASATFGSRGALLSTNSQGKASKDKGQYHLSVRLSLEQLIEYFVAFHTLNILNSFAQESMGSLF